MHLLLAAGSQAVHVVNNPALHVRVVNGADQLAIRSERWAYWTLIATVAGVVIAALAATFGLVALFKTQDQLNILLRKPAFTMGLWGAGQSALGYPMVVAPNVNFGGAKRYNFRVVVHNFGQIQGRTKGNISIALAFSLQPVCRLGAVRCEIFTVREPGAGCMPSATPRAAPQGFIGRFPTNWLTKLAECAISCGSR